MKNVALCAQVVVSGENVYVEVYGIGTDGGMYYKLWDGGVWQPSVTAWLPLGGGFNSVPTSALQGVDFFVPDVEVFCIGLDDQMYHRAVALSWPPPTESWQAFGGVFTSALVAMLWGPNQNGQAIIGLGTDSQPYLKVFDENGNWLPSATGWLPLGGLLSYEPAIASSVGTSAFIFGVGGDRQMYQMALDGSHWPPATTPWLPIGGCFSSAPAVAMWSKSRIDVFGVGSDGAMHHRPWDNGGWLGDWESLGGLFDSPPAVVAWAANRLDIFGLGTDDQMYHKAWDGTQWLPSPAGWEALGGVFNSAPTVVSTGPDRLDIFGLGTDNTMYHKAWDGTQWLPSPTDWEALGGVFEVPQPTQAPSRLDFDAQVTFSSGAAVGGPVHVTLFSDGTSVFSGHMHDSGVVDYNYIVVCRVIDAEGNAYQFVQSGSVAGTVSPGESRDSTWSNNGNAVAEIAANWNDLFPCAGAQLAWYANVNVDLTSLLASIATGGLTSVINVTFR